MSDAPERIAVWPDFVGHPSMTGQWSANTHPDNAVAYVRADLSDALLREAIVALSGCVVWMETLRVSGDAGFWEWDEDSFAYNCASTTLPKLRAHLEDKT